MSDENRHRITQDYLRQNNVTVNMAYTCLIVLDPEIPFTLPEMKGISGTDGANYKVIK